MSIHSAFRANEYRYLDLWKPLGRHTQNPRKPTFFGYELTEITTHVKAFKFACDGKQAPSIIEQCLSLFRFGETAMSAPSWLDRSTCTCGEGLHFDTNAGYPLRNQNLARTAKGD